MLHHHCQHSWFVSLTQVWSWVQCSSLHSWGTWQIHNLTITPGGFWIHGNGMPKYSSQILTWDSSSWVPAAVGVTHLVASSFQQPKVLNTEESPVQPQVLLSVRDSPDMGPRVDVIGIAVFAAAETAWSYAQRNWGVTKENSCFIIPSGKFVVGQGSLSGGSNHLR